MEAFGNFINPFEVENIESLYCLSSGVPVSQEIEQDLLNADRLGEEAASTFIKERMVEKRVSFNAAIKKLNLKTFGKNSKVRNTYMQNQKVQGKKRL